MNVSQIAEKIHILKQDLKLILEGKCNLNGEVALRLGKFFNTGANFWMNLQQAYDLEIAKLQLVAGRVGKLDGYSKRF
ncbi:MAG: HigA family addiction module antitoxin [Crocosphaera sp.]|nr:HigA family addiction module antitoxin [Crocosphaera sp.]